MTLLPSVSAIHKRWAAPDESTAMTTTSNTDTRSQLRRRNPRGFTSRTLLWFLGLSVVYCLYALRGLLDLRDSYPLLTSLAMMLGPTSIALSLLVSAAVFAAATGRFLLPGGWSRAWVSVALFGLGAVFLSTLGPRSAKYLVAMLTTQVADSPAHVGGGAIPLAIAILVVVSGAAGSAVGRMTQRSSAMSRHFWSWVACLGLVVAFVIPLVVASQAVIQGASAVWVLVGPLTIPILAMCFLISRTRVREKQPSLGGSEQFTTAVDAETLDRMVSAVIEADGTEELDMDGLVESESERQMLDLVTALRKESAAVAISESRAQEIVGKVLATPPHIRAPNCALGLRVDTRTVGQFCSSWVCLAVGLVVVGTLGGVTPQITAAVLVGLLGASAVMLLPRWIPDHSNPISM